MSRPGRGAPTPEPGLGPVQPPPLGAGSRADGSGFQGVDGPLDQPADQGADPGADPGMTTAGRLAPPPSTQARLDRARGQPLAGCRAGSGGRRPTRESAPEMGADPARRPGTTSRQDDHLGLAACQQARPLGPPGQPPTREGANALGQSCGVDHCPMKKGRRPLKEAPPIHPSTAD